MIINIERTMELEQQYKNSRCKNLHTFLMYSLLQYFTLPHEINIYKRTYKEIVDNHSRL